MQQKRTVDSLGSEIEAARGQSLIFSKWVQAKSKPGLFHIM